MLKLNEFPLKTFDKIRFADTDAQGHVNNSVFSTYLETGRAEFLYNDEFPIITKGSSFVIASLNINYLKEMIWPGVVDIGTGVMGIGNSSIKIYQQLFVKNVCVADAETIIVQVDNVTAKSKPLSEAAKNTLNGWLVERID